MNNNKYSVTKVTSDNEVKKILKLLPKEIPDFLISELYDQKKYWFRVVDVDNILNFCNTTKFRLRCAHDVLNIYDHCGHCEASIRVLSTKTKRTDNRKDLKYIPRYVFITDPYEHRLIDINDIMKEHFTIKKASV